MKVLGCSLLLLAASWQVGAAQQTLSFLPNGSTVLFQGDSITDGGRWREGTDKNHIMGQDYAYIVAGQIGADEPGRDFQFLNRGISGDRVVDLAARWTNDTIALHPALLSILIGINDDLAEGVKVVSPEQFQAVYDQLLARTLKELPSVKIVLGEPFLLPAGKHKATFAPESEVLQKRQAIVKGLADKYHLPLARYQQALNDASKNAPAEYWTWDGIHPTYAGHTVLAREWLRTVQAFWGNQPAAQTAP